MGALYNPDVSSLASFVEFYVSRFGIFICDFLISEMGLPKRVAENSGVISVILKNFTVFFKISQFSTLNQGRFVFLLVKPMVITPLVWLVGRRTIILVLMCFACSILEGLLFRKQFHYPLAYRCSERPSWRKLNVVDNGVQLIFTLLLCFHKINIPKQLFIYKIKHNNIPHKGSSHIFIKYRLIWWINGTMIRGWCTLWGFGIFNPFIVSVNNFNSSVQHIMLEHENDVENYRN